MSVPFHSLRCHSLGAGSLTRLGVLRLVIPLRDDDVQVADSRRSLLVRPVIVGVSVLAGKVRCPACGLLLPTRQLGT